MSLLNKSVGLFLTALSLLGTTSSTNLEATPCFDFYGFLRADAQYNSRIPIILPGIPYTEAALVPTDDISKGQFSQVLFDCRYSRLGIIGEDCFCNTWIRAVVEIDFLSQTRLTIDPRLRQERTLLLAFSNSDATLNNGYLPRLRHLFIEADFCNDWYLIFGQTWSRWVSIDIANPPLLDYLGPVGSSRVRQLELAVGRRFGCNWMCNSYFDVVVSAEKQALLRNSIEKIVQPHPEHNDEATGYGQYLPLFIAKASFLGNELFQAEVAFAGTQDRFIRGEVAPGFLQPKVLREKSYRKDAFGWYAAVQTQIGNIQIFGRYRYLNGLNRLGGLDYPDVCMTQELLPLDQPHRDLHTIRSQGWYAGATWIICPGTTTWSAVYGHTFAHRVPGSLFDTRIPSDTTPMCKATSYQTSLIHNFWCHWEIGAEYKIYLTRKFNGVRGNMQIIDVALAYNF